MTLVHIYPLCVEGIEDVSRTNSKTEVEDSEDTSAWWVLLLFTAAGIYHKKRSYQKRLSKVYYFGQAVSCFELDSKTLVLLNDIIDDSDTIQCGVCR